MHVLEAQEIRETGNEKGQHRGGKSDQEFFPAETDHRSECGERPAFSWKAIYTHNPYNSDYSRYFALTSTSRCSLNAVFNLATFPAASTVAKSFPST